MSLFSINPSMKGRPRRLRNRQLADRLENRTMEEAFSDLHARPTSQSALQGQKMKRCNDTVAAEFDPTHFLEEKKYLSECGEHVALIILNCPIGSYEHFKHLFDHAAYTVCADGGANRLHDLLKEQFSNEELTTALGFARPDIIHGDLDSLKDEVRQHYATIGVKISQDPDQYSTDFTKAVKKVVEEAPQTRDVLVLGSIGGRVDQGIGLLHEIYREQSFRHPSLRFWLFSEASVSVLLQPGKSVIRTPLRSALITQNVGILPLYGKAILTLQGFEWDVEDWSSEMGGQLSTSNHIRSDPVSVMTDTTVLFTIERRVGRRTQRAQVTGGSD